MKAVHKVIYTCEEASKRMVRDRKDLTFMERFRIKMHIMMCRGCNQFNIQNKWIDAQLKKLSGMPSALKMDEACREKIEKALNSEISKSNK